MHTSANFTVDYVKDDGFKKNIVVLFLNSEQLITFFSFEDDLFIAL